MKAQHIPAVVGTGCFISGSIFRILVEEHAGTSYSIQYRATSIEEVKKYMEKFASILQQEHSEKYADKFVAFRTLLEEA